MKNLLAFTFSTLTVLPVAALIIFRYAVPMLTPSVELCRFGGGFKSFGCSSSLGTLMTFIFAAVALALAGIWSRFGGK